MAVATSTLNLRLFSTGGVQRGLLSLHGPILTMAGYRQNLAVVLQGGPGKQDTKDFCGVWDYPKFSVFG